MDEVGRKKHIREPPSVPFLWEVKPGIPKKDWKPEVSYSSLGHAPKTPLKLIASVPFVWEEKPGKPLPVFSDSQVSVESVPQKPHADLIHVEASFSGHSVAACSNYGYDDKDKESSSDERERITGMDLEAFSSVPSLLANCLVPSAKISTAIPLKKHNCDQLETPSSPTSSETESTSSCATGMSSPVGASFLEHLFPLYPPKSGFLERDEHSENVSYTPLELKAEDFDQEKDNISDVVRRPPTLGELIMMSRRRSCRRKAVQMRKWDPPRKITRQQAFGCFNFVTSNSMIEGLLKRKYFPRVKLVWAG